MKLFGNKKRRPAQKEARQQEPQQQETRQQKPQQQTAERKENRQTETVVEESGKLSAKTKAALLLVASVCVFISAVAMCLTLVAKSAAPLVIPTEEEPKELAYAVNSVQPSTVDVPTEMEAPVSRYDSDTLNILLIGLDTATKQTDTLLLASVDMHYGELSLLSIPRDTYVAGNYETPKISVVYGKADDGKGRGVQAVREMVKNMVGFEPDYYFVLDEASVSAMTDLAGGVEFTVPDTPEYSVLSAGKQKLNGAQVMQLLCYREEYTDVETEPTAVQRELLLTLLEALLKDPEAYLENAEKILTVADTDLSAENIAYLAYLLQNMDTSSVFSRALPGGEIAIDGVAYYEVNPEAAIELLNAHFNPFEKALTVYDVNFRQKTGDSGSGNYDPYGFPSASTSTEETQDSTQDSSEETTVPTEGPDATDPTDSSDPTQPPETSTETPPPPETEAPATEP